MHRVFVYGSLKRGFINHCYLEGSRLLGVSISDEPLFNMVSLGTFPAVIKGSSYIKGELYLVDDETLEKLDLLEGNGHLYNRVEIKVNGENAWLYIYNYPIPAVHIKEENTMLSWVEYFVQKWKYCGI